VKLLWLDRSREDYERWRKTDPAVFKMINALVGSIRQNSYEGLGRPKALERDLAGWWSREITNQHRLVYRIAIKRGKSVLEIAQCRFHYVGKSARPRRGRRS
jgi:toxin YoeB